MCKWILDDGLSHVRTALTSFKNCTNPFRIAILGRAALKKSLIYEMYSFHFYRGIDSVIPLPWPVPETTLNSLRCPTPVHEWYDTPCHN